jgi:hypothetical protein
MKGAPRVSRYAAGTPGNSDLYIYIYFRIKSSKEE